ncbi:MAG TPA: S41 family peptidase [Candidatus Baltobacteraceae bacterium]|jgi:carboxyl-terminal processing protease|nr:S41 family peptidase [Candidatus Baltobacteraceae bacterium]
MTRAFSASLALLLLASGVMVGIGPAASAALELSAQERNELSMSYSLMANEYYEKIPPQTLLSGAHTNLLQYLQRRGIERPNLPSVEASADEHTNESLLQHQVADAAFKYGNKIGTNELTWASIAGMLGSVHDRYTIFLSPKDYAALNEGLDGGNFGGIGVSIHVDEATKLLTAVDVISGTPAERSGLQSGDVITEVDGQSTKGLTVEQDSVHLRGKPGSVVRLTVVRNGTPLSTPISIVRETIHEPSVYSHMIGANIGYVRLSVFGETTTQEVSAALKRLETQGAKAYVLDLRDNGGGYLNAAIGVSSAFIDNGPIVTVSSRSDGPTQYDADAGALPSRPLAVLVNQYTASASEITSGALQDDGVGTLIGVRTFGKGVVQTIHPLPDGSAIKITTARYFTPSGRDINKVGITPDIIESQPKNARYGDLKTDHQLKAALGYLQQQLSKLNN